MASKVLIVDDDVEFRRLAARVIAAMGLQVVGEAGTYAEGAAAAAELRPDAALVDVGLPDGDGIALAAHLVALPWRPRVVVASSDPDASSTEAVQRFGAVGFIAKEALPDGTLAAMFSGG
jgi:DNA-binding NarL/FixJ family response regulator